jgi:rare lipoprotein A
MQSRGVSVLLALLALLTGCARRSKVVAPIARSVGWTESGIASWYGHPYHGRAAANGEIYDMEKLTAAHRTLPFDTWVAVTNITNQKRVEVRIIDRGPFVQGRIIDLSHAAARAVDLIGPGTAKVRLRVIETPANATVPLYAVQIGSFRERSTAERLRHDLNKRYGAAVLVPRDGRPALWRVLVGREASMENASVLAGRLRAQFDQAFVVRLDPRPER